MSNKKGEEVTMRVRIGNSEIEVSGPRDFVETKIDEFIKEMKESAKRTEPGSHPAMAEIKGTVPGTRKKVSAAQFFRRLSPKSDVERFLIAGYFLENFENVEKFTTADILLTLKKAKIRPPKNPSDVIYKNAKKGNIMAAGDKDGKLAYVLTSDGELAVNDAKIAAE